MRAQVAGKLRPFETLGEADHVVGTSKTFKQLARLAGAPGAEEGERVPRMLSLADLDKWVPKLAAMTYDERAELPGVSTGRAPQLLAGAIVAEAVMACSTSTRCRSAPGRCARASSCADSTGSAPTTDA